MSEKCPKCGAEPTERLWQNRPVFQCGSFWERERPFVQSKVCKDSQIVALKKQMADVKAEAGLSWGVVEMVREALIGLGCEHGPETHKATPPMMYPEWIGCVVAHHEGVAWTVGRRAGLEEAADWHDGKVEIWTRKCEKLPDGKDALRAVCLGVMERNEMCADAIRRLSEQDAPPAVPAREDGDLRLVEEAFFQLAFRSEGTLTDGWYDTLNEGTAYALGERLVDAGLCEREPDGRGKRQRYRRVKKAEQPGPERLRIKAKVTAKPGRISLVFPDDEPSEGKEGA